MRHGEENKKNGCANRAGAAESGKAVDGDGALGALSNAQEGVDDVVGGRGAVREDEIVVPEAWV